MHQLAQPQILPGGLLHLLGGLCDAEGGVLVGDHVVLVLRVDGLQVRGHVNLVGGQLVLAKVVKEVGDPGRGHVDVRVVSVLVLKKGKIS